MLLLFSELANARTEFSKCLTLCMVAPLYLHQVPVALDTTMLRFDTCDLCVAV